MRFFLFIAVISAMTAQAAPPSPEMAAELSAYAGHVLMGIEIELSRPLLQRIIHHFDFEAYQKKHPDIIDKVPISMVESYLDDPMNFEALPLELRQELAQGLNGFKITLQGANSDLHSPFPGAKSRIKIPEPSTLLNSSLNQGIEIRQAEGGLYLTQSDRARANWQEILKRWRALPPERSRGAIQISRLSRQDRVELISNHSDTRMNDSTIDVRFLGLREDLPVDLRRRYESLVWSVDGVGVVEFKHRNPVSDPNELLRHLYDFADMVGIRKILDHPLESIVNGAIEKTPTSLHLHMSFPNEDTSNRAAIAGLTRLFRAYAEGFHVARGDGQVRLQSMREKGLQRQIGQNRTEVRFQDVSPDKQVQRTLRELSSDQAAIGELLSLMTTSNFKAVLEDVLSERNHLTAQDLSKAEKLTNKSLASFSEALTKMESFCGARCSLTRLSLEHFIESYLSSPSSVQRINALALAGQLRYLSPKMSRSLRAEIMRVLQSPDPKLASSLLFELRYSLNSDVRNICINIISSNKYKHLHSAALLSFANNPDPRAIKLSYRIAERSLDEDARGQAFRIIAASGTARARRILLNSFKDSSNDDLIESLFLFIGTRDPKLLSIASKYLNHPAQMVTTVATAILVDNPGYETQLALALPNIRGQLQDKVISKLVEKRHKPPDLQIAIVNALEKLDIEIALRLLKALPLGPHLMPQARDRLLQLSMTRPEFAQALLEMSPGPIGSDKSCGIVGSITKVLSTKSLAVKPQ